MRITTVRIATAKTINLGNFQSLRIEADVTAEIAEGDSLTDAKALLQVELSTLLAETYRAQRKEPGEPAQKTAASTNPPPGTFKPATPATEY